MEPVYIEICSFCSALCLLERVGHVTTLTALTKPLAPIFPVLLVIPVCSSPRSFPWLHSYFPPYPRRTGQLTFFRSDHVRFSHLPTPFLRHFFSSCQPLIPPDPVGSSTLKRSSSATPTQSEQIGNEQLQTAARNGNPSSPLGDCSLERKNSGGEREPLPAIGERLVNERHHLGNEQSDENGNERGFSMVAGSPAKGEETLHGEDWRRIKRAWGAPPR